MTNLATDFVGIRSPNPFWLAPPPPTDKEYVAGGRDAAEDIHKMLTGQE